MIRFFRKILGVENRSDSSTLDTLMERQSDILKELSLLTNILRQDGTYRDSFWLHDNRVERMDATKSLFDENRRKFHLMRYEFASSYCTGKNVADIACGTGYGTELLARDGKAGRVIGVDISSEAIAYARRVHPFHGVSYEVYPGDDTGIADNSLDLVVSFETIEHVPDDVRLLSEFSRILKVDGTLICSTPNQWPIESSPCHVREYCRDSFVNLLSHHFEVHGLYNQNSGGTTPFNHGQPAGITPTTESNHSLAECFIAVCNKR